MDDITKSKLIAAGKIALGSARMASGLLTATGHGLIGAACRRHHMMRQAFHIGRMSMMGGRHQLDEGLAEWKKAHS
jgi:hypothetical protein